MNLLISELQGTLKEVQKIETEAQRMLKSEENLKTSMARNASKICCDIKDMEEELMVKKLIVLGNLFELDSHIN